MFIKRLQNVSLQNVHFSLLGYTRLQRFIFIRFGIMGSGVQAEAKVVTILI
jgi:hypothetical protein